MAQQVSPGGTGYSVIFCLGVSRWDSETLTSP